MRVEEREGRGFWVHLWQRPRQESLLNITSTMRSFPRKHPQRIHSWQNDQGCISMLRVDDILPTPPKNPSSLSSLKFHPAFSVLRIQHFPTNLDHGVDSIYSKVTTCWLLPNKEMCAVLLQRFTLYRFTRSTMVLW